MLFYKTVIRILNSALNLVIIAILLTAGTYSAYALWDNNRIYSAAGDVQADMIQMKPELDTQQDSGADFSQLLEVNPDVCAWVSLDGTQVDYPVLQGETNFTYINTDVYGDFALAGSIFLDTRNDRSFSDTYHLIYGHHMADSKMFGDLELYKDEKFFGENQTGCLILPEKTYDLEIFACLLVPASEDNIFKPTSWHDDNIENLLSFVESDSLHFDAERIDKMRHTEKPIQILAFSTCSYEFSDARTIVLTRMVPHTAQAVDE